MSALVAGQSGHGVRPYENHPDELYADIGRSPMCLVVVRHLLRLRSGQARVQLQKRGMHIFYPDSVSVDKQGSAFPRLAETARPVQGVQSSE